MPNTVVKLTNAESTWLEAAWEDRKLLIKEKALTIWSVLFLELRFEFRELRGGCKDFIVCNYEADGQRHDTIKDRVEI